MRKSSTIHIKVRKGLVMNKDLLVLQVSREQGQPYGKHDYINAATNNIECLKYLREQECSWKGWDCAKAAVFHAGKKSHNTL